MSSTRYDRLVREAKFGVKLIHKEYCSGKEIAYVIILTGLGDYFVGISPEEGHNNQAVIDAIHQYYAETKDARVIEGYQAGIYELIEASGHMKMFSNLLRILFYELYKEHSGEASFTLNMDEIFRQLNSMIVERYHNFEKEDPSFEPWFSRYQQSALEDYGLILQGKPEQSS